MRTSDQTSYTKFWYEFSEAGWNRVARTVVASKNLNMLEAARLFALVDMAIADAYIAGWDSKFHYNFWRPYTAIRNAANDGNNATTGDATWEPAEPTPPVQDYPSTHSALGNAAAESTALESACAAIFDVEDNSPAVYSFFVMSTPLSLKYNQAPWGRSFTYCPNESIDPSVRI